MFLINRVLEYLYNLAHLMFLSPLIKKKILKLIYYYIYFIIYLFIFFTSFSIKYFKPYLNKFQLMFWAPLGSREWKEGLKER